MKKLLTLFSVLTFALTSNAQVSGIAASKLATFNAHTLSSKTLEFEPSFSTSWSNAYFDNNGEKINRYNSNDSLQVGIESSFRITYGINNRVEAGFSIPTSGIGISVGTKVLIFNKMNLAFAGIAGFNSNPENEIIHRTSDLYVNSPSVSGGIAVSYQATDKLALDFDSQLQKTTSQTNDNHLSDFFVNLDAGYFITPEIQPVIGINYYSSNFDNKLINSELLILNLGVTIETANNFLMVLNTPLILSGKNAELSKGFGFALTIMLD